MSSNGENPNRRRDESESDEDVEILGMLKNPDDERVKTLLKQLIEKAEMTKVVEGVEGVSPQQSSETLSNAECIVISSDSNASNAEPGAALNQNLMPELHVRPEVQEEANKVYMWVAQDNAPIFQVYGIRKPTGTTMEFVAPREDNISFNLGVNGEMLQGMRYRIPTEEHVAPQIVFWDGNADDDVIVISSDEST